MYRMGQALVAPLIQSGLMKRSKMQNVKQKHFVQPKQQPKPKPNRITRTASLFFYTHSANSDKNDTPTYQKHKQPYSNEDFMIQQLKGALKLALIINIMIAALNIWILKDQRHISFYITDPQSEAIIVDKQALAYEEMN